MFCFLGADNTLKNVTDTLTNLLEPLNEQVPNFVVVKVCFAFQLNTPPRSKQQLQLFCLEVNDGDTEPKRKHKNLYNDRFYMVLFCFCLCAMSKMCRKCMFFFLSPQKRLNPGEFTEVTQETNLCRSKSSFAKKGLGLYISRSVIPGRGIKKKCQLSYFYVFLIVLQCQCCQHAAFSSEAEQSVMIFYHRGCHAVCVTHFHHAVV